MFFLLMTHYAICFLRVYLSSDFNLKDNLDPAPRCKNIENFTIH